jgi:hypothetical protein
MHVLSALHAHMLTFQFLLTVQRLVLWPVSVFRLRLSRYGLRDHQNLSLKQQGPRQLFSLLCSFVLNLLLHVEHLRSIRQSTLALICLLLQCCFMPSRLELCFSSMIMPSGWLYQLPFQSARNQC